MPDKDLEILIRTKAELAGAKAAEAQLERDIGKAKALGKEYANLEAQLKKVRAGIADYNQAQKDGAAALDNLSPQTRDYINKLKEADAAGKGFELTHRDIHLLTRSLTRSMPELGHVLGELTNPWLALGIGVSVVTGQMLEYWNQTQQIKNDPGPDWETNQNKIEAVRQAFSDAALSAASFDRELLRIATRRATPAETFQRELDAFTASKKDETDLMTAEQKRQSAALDQAEKMGLMTHAQVVAAKLAMDEEYTRKRLDLENQLAKNELVLKQQQLAQAQFEAHADSETLPNLEKTAAERKAALDRNQAIIDDAKANLDKAKAQRDKTGAEATEAQLDMNKVQGQFAPLEKTVFGDRLKVAESQQIAAIGEVAFFRDQLKKAQEAAPGLKDAANQADEDLQTVKDRLKDMFKTIHDLRVSIPVSQDRAVEASRSRAAVAGTDFQASSISAAQSVLSDPRALFQAQTGAQTLLAGGSVNQQQAQLLSALNQVFQGTGRSNQQILQLITDYHQLVLQLQRRVAELAGQMNTLKQNQ